MTADSDAAPETVAPAAVEPAPLEPAKARSEDSQPALAKGHLHPAILLLRLLDAMRQAVFPVVAGLVIQHWFLVLAGVMFLVQLGYALVRYLTLEYRLTANELRVREGLLHRQERRIPLDRIQDLGFESTILRRALGLTVVLVETASGSGVEARFDSLGRADADHLREVLLAARRRIVAEEQARDGSAGAPTTTDADATRPATADPDEPEWLVHRSSTGELLVRGLTDLRLSAFAVTGFAAFEFADQLGIIGQLEGTARSIRDWFAGLDPVVLAAVLGVLLFAVMAFGIVTATIGSFAQFFGFQLTLRGSVLLRRYGLLTTRQKTLPRERIQRVTLEMPWLRRLTGYCSIKADSAGGSRAQGEDTTGGWDVVVPLTRLPSAMALLPAMLPGLEREHLPWQRGSHLLVARTTIGGALLAAFLIGGGWPFFGPMALIALLVVPIWALLGMLAYRNLAFALGGDFLALRHGIIGSYLAYLPTKKVQSVVVRQSPIEQLLGLAELTVHVAGGSPTRLPDLTIENARQLRAALAAIAVAAAARDWVKAEATAVTTGPDPQSPADPPVAPPTDSDDTL